MVNSVSFDHRLTFESFGVRVVLESDNVELLRFATDIAEKALVGNIVFLENDSGKPVRTFGLRSVDGSFEQYENGIRTNHGIWELPFFKYFNSMLRLTIAENAVDRVFVHSGVVGWEGNAVLFPARSFKGKTTIVVELIKLGAEYFSDEYAVIDLDGYVHPFPRDLSIRGLNYEFDETEVPPSLIGKAVGDKPVPIGSVILTEFEKGSIWEPEVLSVGQGVLETMPHAISLFRDTELTMRVLARAFESAVIHKGPRGEAPETATKILEFLNSVRN